MMKVLCTRLAQCEAGATAIEYGLTAALVSVALFTGAGALSDTITGQFTALSQKMSSATELQKQFGSRAALTELPSPAPPPAPKPKAASTSTFATITPLSASP